MLHLPRNMVGRKLAGQWDKEREVAGKIEEIETVKSIRSAPSIL